ncbi:hypothetical protein BH23THE1_BH23THE1_34560 [soil metagenome]
MPVKLETTLKNIHLIDSQSKAKLIYECYLYLGKTITCLPHFSRFKLETGISQNPHTRIPLKTYDSR